MIPATKQNHRIPSTTMNPRRKALLMFSLMCAASGVGFALKPGQRSRSAKPAYLLEDLIPTSFGLWKTVPKTAVTVNPQTQQLLDSLYSQILERTYVHPDGYQVMLAVAYGNDQRGTLEAHKPEVCYPAQGFKVLQIVDHPLQTPYGDVPTRRLETVAGQRHEPVMYWFTVANNIVQTKFQKRLVEIKLALTGQIPDGILFRASSIDPVATHAWDRQSQFVNDLLAAVQPGTRTILAGLAP